MSIDTTDKTVFKQAPIYETGLSVQFEPIDKMRATFVGEFYSVCLKEHGWLPTIEMERIPYEDEDIKSQYLVSSPEADRLIDSIGIRFVFSNEEWKAVLHLQADRLVLQQRRTDDSIAYEEIRERFISLFSSFYGFVQKSQLGEVEPNLWDVSYTNVIYSPDAADPENWWRVLPGLFQESGPRIANHPWRTFEGTWYFLLPNETGRLRVKTKKILPNPDGKYAIHLVLKATGRNESGWQKGMDFGHESITKAFHALISSEARKEWETGNEST